MRLVMKKENYERTELQFFDRQSKDLRYAFPITDGEVIPCTRTGSGEYQKCSEEECEWWQNYQNCLQNKRLISEVNTIKWTEHIGICECGCIFTLRDKFYGSCDCPECGTWYSLCGGSECLPPEQQMECPDF